MAFAAVDIRGELLGCLLDFILFFELADLLCEYMLIQDYTVYAMVLNRVEEQPSAEKDVNEVVRLAGRVQTR